MAAPSCASRAWFWRTALFVMTPDPVRPAWFDKLDGMADAAFADRILWFSFRDLAQAVTALTLAERLASSR